MSAGSGISILVLGATGFIGGDILFALLEQDRSLNWAHVGALTSSQSKGMQITEWARKSFDHSAAEKLHVEVVDRGDGGADTYYSHVEKVAATYDYVVQAATSDDLKLTQAINRGLEEGKKNGRKGKLMHFSGVQLIESEPVGEYVETPLYDDANNAQISSIPDSAAHRTIDIEIDQARVAGKIDATIICPALVWGVGRGPGSRISQCAPDMVRKAIVNGQPVYVGKGNNVWTNVNVNEQTDFLIALLKAQLSPSWAPAAKPWETFYFTASTQFHIYKDLAAAVGKALTTPPEDGSLLPHGAEPKSVPVPKWDKSQKGVRIEDDARDAGAGDEAQAKIEARTPFWPNRTNNRALANRARSIPGAPGAGGNWFPTVFDEKHMISDHLWTVKQLRENNALPQYQAQ